MKISPAVVFVVLLYAAVVTASFLMAPFPWSLLVALAVLLKGILFWGMIQKISTLGSLSPAKRLQSRSAGLTEARLHPKPQHLTQRS